MSPPQSATTPTTTTEPTEQQQTYLEVWGDTVNGRHLAISVLVGSVVGASTLLAAQALFERVVSEPSLAQAYSLLVGIAACLLAGVVCGIFIKPKRIVALAAADAESIDGVITMMSEQRQGLGTLADIPEQSQQELRELGLYDHFATAEAEQAPASNAPKDGGRA
ncbi:hypothetical protein QM716_12605 [Rhodococcus sp. IEGM 1409]|uniref:hypothetical protein n=1 Tax=Rhodococcus sp. IEGM 1409 TaxID=3047082 RepID=UPI0024B725AA|nr:hypothetical protein [Rhodococcus sp. IEGM 1409]MDI9900694.1 hypothetical protein [Rhodococcus sp. IEGM 1409]